MFKSVELDQAEFSETNESLLVIDRLANGGNPANKTNKGNNLHNLYLTRSYSCTVESLGNMMIQPLQYFELTNIPMFYGTYLITEVKHNVKPHYIGTTFKGVRQPIMTVPVVEDVATAMAMTLKNIKAKKSSGDPLRGGGSGGSSGGGGPLTPPVVSGQKVDIDGIDYIDMGANSPSEYINHKYRGKNKPGKTPKYRKDVDTIVMHWTAGWTLKQALSVLQKKGLHYHLIASEDGTLVQVSDLQRKGWHAGNACGSSSSSHKGHQGLNSKSIGVNYAGGIESGWCIDGEVQPYIRTPEQWNQDKLTVPFCPNGVKMGSDGYYQCSDNGLKPKKCGHGTEYAPKKQFGALIKACILAKRAHPTIKRLTSHHWITTRKTDLGDRFPWGEFMAALKATDPNGGWENVELWSKVPNNCPGKGGGYVRDESRQNISMGDVDIDLDLSGGALDVELTGNKGNDPNNNKGVTGKRTQTKGTRPGTAVQTALKYAGKI